MDGRKNYINSSSCNNCWLTFKNVSTRISIKQRNSIEVFKPFFDKTHKAVLSMSIVVSILALVLSIITKNWWWFGISALMHLNGPYTIKFMMPTNRRLMAENVDPDSEQTQNDLKNWGSLHAVRTIWNGLIFLAFIVLLVYFV